MFRWSFLFSFLFYFSYQTSAQLEFQNTLHDYGVIQKTSMLVSEFVVTNSGTEDAYLLRVDGSPLFAFSLLMKPIKPGQSDTIKLYYKPEQKGIFSEKLKVYLSSQNEPIILEIKGEIRELEKEKNTCYSFAENHADTYKKVAVAGQMAKVINKKTHNPLQSSFVQLFGLNDMIVCGYTKPDGKFSFTITPGLYEIRARADNYRSYKKEIYLNKNTTDIVIELEEIEIDTQTNYSAKYNEIKTASLPEKKEEIKQEVKIEPEAKPATKDLVNGELNKDIFKSNNIVLLLDVSGSMEEKNKIGTLKNSVKDLVSKLSNDDKISIITYADLAKIKLQPTAVSDKNYIYKIIDSLKARGSTSTTMGLQKAFELNRSSLISNGNNQIIIVTDGDFIVSKRDREMIKKYCSGNDKTIVSAMGINCSNKSEQTLKELADMAGGSFLSVGAENFQNIIIDEIKLRSRKNK